MQTWGTAVFCRVRFAFISIKLFYLWGKWKKLQKEGHKVQIFHFSVASAEFSILSTVV